MEKYFKILLITEVEISYALIKEQHYSLCLEKSFYGLCFNLLR